VWFKAERGMIHTEIRLIDVLDPICNHRIRNNEEVEFPDELSLLWAVILCVPVVPSSSLAFGMHVEIVVQSRQDG
jgi:hypothetical protein